MAAAESFVVASAELADGERKVFQVGGNEIGVYRIKGALHAYENWCPHQGGPACEGLIMPKVEEAIAADRTSDGLRFNHDEPHIVCPWHGWEYDLATGVMVADRRFRLRKFEVFERDGGIWVRL